MPISKVFERAIDPSWLAEGTNAQGSDRVIAKLLHPSGISASHQLKDFRTFVKPISNSGGAHRRPDRQILHW